MVWTEPPRTYVANEVLTAPIANTHWKDQLDVLSTHAHDGSPGQGNDELSGIDQIAWDDKSASPSAAGELQRNGVNLEWYGAAVVAITEADAVVGVASPRTLGPGPRQGAAGDHSHTFIEQDILDGQGGVSDSSTYQDQDIGGGTTQTTASTVFSSASGANVMLAGFGTGVQGAGVGGQADLSLIMDGVTEDQQLNMVLGTHYVMRATRGETGKASYPVNIDLLNQDGSGISIITTVASICIEI